MQMCVMVGVFDVWVVLYVLGVACYLWGWGQIGKAQGGARGDF